MVVGQFADDEFHFTSLLNYQRHGADAPSQLNLKHYTELEESKGKTLGNNKGSIQNFGIVGVTIAIEEISKFIFFYCPCDYPRNQMYGTIFIWGPSIVLLIAGYLANRRTWRLTTGLCNRGHTSKRMKRFVHFISTFTSIGVKAMIAPASWLVLAFLKGDYYTCAHWPDPYYDVNQTRKYYQLQYDGPLPKPCQFNSNPAKANLKLEAEVIARTLRAESHTIGWLFISMGMLLSVIIMFLLRCNSRFSYEQSNYIDRYRQHELELFEEKMDAKSKKLAQLIVDTYLSKTRSKKDWDKIAVIEDKVTRSENGKAIYSPLHQFVNKQLIEDEKECTRDEEKRAIIAATKIAIKDGNVVEESAKTRKAKKPENQKSKTDAGNTQSHTHCSERSATVRPSYCKENQRNQQYPVQNQLVTALLPIKPLENPHH